MSVERNKSVLETAMTVFGDTPNRERYFGLYACLSALIVALMAVYTHAAAAAPAPPLAPSAPPSLYARVGARLAAQPALAEQLGKPAPQLAEVRWLLGTWEVTATVLATASAPESVSHGTSVVTQVIGGTWLQFADSYPSGTQDLGFLTYNLVTGEWQSIGLDSTGNAVMTTARGWDGPRLALTGTVTIVGETVTLRQTIERESDSAFRLLNEERLPDGSWRALDTYRFRRRLGG